MSDATEKRPGFAPRAATARQPALVLLYSPHMDSLPAAVPLGAAPLTVGREAPTGGLVLAESAASRLHARFAASERGVSVLDLGSSNGVVVDGRRVERALLADGAIVRVGDTFFKVVTEDGTGYDAYPPGRADAGDAIVGGLRMAAVRKDVALVAPRNLSVLVRGETGTGKELVAEALHRASGRHGRLVAVNCAALPPHLVESELFGFRKGAFTGADRDYLGFFRSAHGGTLFLDEIGDLAQEAQAKLLRVLETRQVAPLGSATAEPVDVRIVAATHRDLRACVAAGTFRGDLFARLDGFTLTLPPLRERKEDMVPLVRRFAADAHRPDLRIGPETMAALLQYDWPYNVRELLTTVRRLAVLAEGGALDFAHLPAPLQDAMRHYGEVAHEGSASTPAASSPALSDAHGPPPPLPSRRRPSVEHLRALLAEHDGNVSAVARALAKDRALVDRWIRAASLDPSAFRRPGDGT